jgi:hypothetical protein
MSLTFFGASSVWELVPIPGIDPFIFKDSFKLLENLQFISTPPNNYMQFLHVSAAPFNWIPMLGGDEKVIFFNLLKFL